jgi:hypothetical protein
MLLIFTGTAGASLYQLGDSGWSAVVHPEWDITFSVDYLSTERVIIQIQKCFVGESDEFGLMPAMYVEFIKDSETAVEKIIINDEYIINDTSENWTDFHIELAVGGSQRAGFCYDCTSSGDQFETVELSGSSGYLGLPTRFDFSDGLVVNGPAGENVFRPGYSYGAMVIVTNPEMGVGERILLKEFPTIPEPATLLVLFLAGLGLVSVKMKRRKCA